MLERFRSDPVVSSFRGAIDDKADAATLEHIATLLPDEWLAAGRHRLAAALRRAVLRQFDLGVDGVIMHGATPDELAPVVDAYRHIRPAGRFDDLPRDPGAH